MALRSGPAQAAPPSHVVVGPSAFGIHQARISVLSGTNTVEISRTFGTTSLYRITTARGNGAVPSVKDTHRSVGVHLTGIGSGHGTNLSAQLAPKVAWSIRLAGGASAERLDLSELDISSVSVPAGVSHLSIRLPTPQATSAITVSGASQFDLIAPAAVTVRIDFIGGSGNATLDGMPHTGLAGNTVLTSAGSTTAGTINVTCLGGIGSFTLTRTT
jgi:hypothetical protein